MKYGYAGSERDALEKLQYEFYYLAHQSLRFDARVMARTLRNVLELGGPLMAHGIDRARHRDGRHPTVTVALPVLDEERHLRATLASIAAQTYPVHHRGARGRRRVA